MTEVTHANELREVYLLAFDNSGTDAGEVVDYADGRINHRFARELLTTLETANLLHREDSPDGDTWITAFSFDEDVRDEAVAVIDEFLGRKSVKKATPRVKKEQTYHPCRCGCGENVPSKSFYRPGHDARHAGAVGKAAALLDHDDSERKELYNLLPSQALVTKALGIEEKAREKASKSANRPSSLQPQGTIKVGKNERVARKNEDGSINWLDDAGEWRTASKTAAATWMEDGS